MLTAAEVWRDNEIPSVPASGPHRPQKSDIRAWGAMLEALTSGGNPGLAYPDVAAINNDLAHPANTAALVYADLLPSKNGLYVKAGTSGSGAWTRVGDLPTSVVPLTVTGGTGNAITAVAPETPSQPARKLYLLTPAANNTGAVTLAVNGGGAMPIKNAFGLDLSATALVSGSQVLMAWSVDHYQLLVSAQVDADSILAAALAAEAAAQGSATAAAADAAALGNQAHQYDTRAQAMAAAIPAGVGMLQLYGRGSLGDSQRTSYIRLGGAPGPVRSWHFQNAVDSSWWQMLPSGSHQFEQFGVTGVSAANNLAAIQDAIDFVKANGGGSVTGKPSQQYRVTSMPTMDPTVTMDMRGGSIILDTYTITTIGDSITAGSGASDFNGTISPAKGFAPLLAAHYGWSINNVGRSGNAVADQADECFAVTPGSGSVYTVFLGTNDKIENSSESANREANTGGGHLALLLQLATKQDSNKIRGDAMTVLAGSWSSIGPSIDAHGVFSSTNGSVLEAVVTGTHVVLVGWWNRVQPGQFDVSIDKRNIGSFSALPFGSENLSIGLDFGPFALVFSDLAIGKHTIRIAVSSATGANNVVRISFVAGLSGTVDHTNPLVAVGNLHEFTDAGNTAQGVSFGRNERFNSLIISNIAICQKLGLNVVPVEIYGGINAAVDCPSDGVHPNDGGHAKLRDLFITAIDGSWGSYQRQYPSEFTKAAFLQFRGHPYVPGRTNVQILEWRFRPN
ncbi:SGNH/GDSL hydrolase family protein [Bradyrhizobium lablabi]|uniref:SGNH/GDSL hydrolase family protein n=1 Tax=Bradyrhizobium lablabi TaxID=722472 RepID=UPI001BA5AB39|nr:SGNH/GDSL hydrolase family protein [Bradyrhizobium lablabi]MBR0695940.1 SGNH/GDSL hydrolase family protein [Bradyrhizobium lablabi]